MSNIIIKKTNFVDAKNRINEFAKTKKTPMEIDKVREGGRWFGWAGSSHNVTGSELNKVTSQMQTHLRKLNDLSIEIIREFGTVYTALDKLDTEYIAGILTAIKAAEKTNDDIKVAQKRIEKANEDIKGTQKRIEKANEDIKGAQKRIDNTMVVQQNTIIALKKFMDRVDAYKHLKDIDVLWDAYVVFQKAFGEINKSIQIIQNDLNDTRVSLQQVEEVKQFLSKQKDLKDIHIICNDIDSIKEKINRQTNEYKQIENSIKNLFGSSDVAKNNINALKKRIEGIEKQVKTEGETLVQKLDDKTKSLQSNISNIVAAIANVEAQAKSEREVLADKLVDKANELQDNINSLEDVVANVEATAKSEREALADKLADKANELQDNINSLENVVANVEATAKSEREALADKLADKANELQDNINSLENVVANVEATAKSEREALADKLKKLTYFASATAIVAIAEAIYLYMNMRG